MDERAATTGAPNVTRTSPWSRALIAVCLVVLLAAALRVAIHDPTSEPVSGDQASFVYQALSLRGGDLAYDPQDQARWLALGWADQPHGLFVQARDDGWAFAKPLGYSVLLAPAMALFDATGIALVGAALLLAYAACWYGIGRMRWDRPTALAVATAATVASHAWLFAFPAHADLFVAVLVGVTALAAARVAWPRTSASPLLADRTRHSTSVDPPTDPLLPTVGPDHVAGRAPPIVGTDGGRRPAARPTGAASAVGPEGDFATFWLVVAAAGAALLVTEKLPALVALAPLLLLGAIRAPWRARAIAGVVGALVLGASVAPYLYYSDGASWSAYGGDRYYAIATTPWSGGTEADLTPWRTRDSLSPGFVLDQLTDPSDDLPSATLTYSVGRHTGVLTFQPVAWFLLVAAAGAAIAAAIRRRAMSRHARNSVDTAPLEATAADAAGVAERRDGSTNRDALDEPASVLSRYEGRDDSHQPSVGHGGSASVGVESTSNRRRARGNRLWVGPGGIAIAAALGLAGYVALYLVVFTDNYFGGGQSIGNRYFLQVSPLVALVAVGSPLTTRTARWCAAGAAAWALVVLHPLLRSPEEAFFHLERTSAVQDLLPFDGSQTHSWRFGCEPAECIPPPLEAFDG